MLEKIIQWIKRWVGVGKVHTGHQGSSTGSESVSGETKSDQKKPREPTPPKGNGSPDPGENNPNVEPKDPPNTGSRRGPQGSNPPSPPNNNSRRVPPPRPELICREEAQGTQQWEVVLSVSKECNVKTVRHDDNLLEALNGVYCLSSLTGCLSVEYTDCKKNRYVFPV